MERSVTVIMPVRNEVAYIEGSIRSVVRAGEAVDGLEIIVVDGMSDDGTRELVEGLSDEIAGLKLLDNPEKTVPYALNRGLRAAKYDLVVRVDGHAELFPDFFDQCFAALAAHPDVSCVGGPIENVAEGSVSEAISAALSSPFGVGNARFRTGGREGYVDTLAFGMYRKSALFEVGMFDEELTRNQDDEMNFRLVRSGRPIWFTDKIRSRYFVRSSFGKLWRQFFQYGYWKVYVNRKHRAVTNLRQLAPPAFVAWLALAAIFGLVWAPARWALLLTVCLYLTGALFFASKQARSLAATPRVVLAIVVLHISYGIGYLKGILDFLVLGRATPAARTTELTR